MCSPSSALKKWPYRPSLFADKKARVPSVEETLAFCVYGPRTLTLLLQRHYAVQQEREPSIATRLHTDCSPLAYSYLRSTV